MRPSSSQLQFQLRSIIDELAILLSESGRFQTEDIVRAILQEANSVLFRLRRQIEIPFDRYVLAIVGLSNVGKSTLLNALFGMEIAPCRNGPCTATPIEFEWGEGLHVRAIYPGSFRPHDWDFTSVTEVKTCLTHLVDESEVGNDVPAVVHVCLPHPLLQNGLVLADTPGYGAAQLGENRAGAHETAIREYLQNGVARALWIALAEQAIGQRELEFYDHCLAKICDDLVVTGCEGWTSEEMDRFQRRFGSRFGLRKPIFHFVSGKQGLLARQANDTVGLEATGIPRLVQRISQLASPIQRVGTIAQELQEMTRDLGEWLARHRDSRNRPLQQWWRADSWARWELLPASKIKRTLDEHLKQRES